MSWKNFNYMKPEPVEITIGEDVINFYPMSYRAANELRRMAGPLFEAFTVLVSKNEGDAAHTVDHDKSGNPTKIVVNAVSSDTAELRTNQRKVAVRKAVEALLEPKNTEVVGYILADSMRDVFPRDAKMSEKIEFAESLPVGILAQMVAGLFKANKKVFGPLAEGAGGLLEKGLLAANFDMVPKEEEEDPKTTG